MAHDFPGSNGPLLGKAWSLRPRRLWRRRRNFSVRVRWVLIDLVVQWGDYLKKKQRDWWFQRFLSIINGMIFWVDLYLVAEWRRSLIRVGPMAAVGDLRWEGVAKAVRRYAGWCGAPSLSGSAHKLRATNGVVDLWYSRTMESGNYHVATWVRSLEFFLMGLLTKINKGQTLTIWCIGYPNVWSTWGSEMCFQHFRSW